MFYAARRARGIPGPTERDGRSRKIIGVRTPSRVAEFGRCRLQFPGSRQTQNCLACTIRCLRSRREERCEAKVAHSMVIHDRRGRSVGGGSGIRRRCAGHDLGRLLCGLFGAWASVRARQRAPSGDDARAVDGRLSESIPTLTSLGGEAADVVDPGWRGPPMRLGKREVWCGHADTKTELPPAR